MNQTALPETADDATFPEPDHDHGACVDDALARADEICAERGARLTALRRSVLEIVWDSHAPIGAYEILERLQTARRADTDEPARAAPPTVYRALDFLLEHGLAHRIESLNAYVGCSRPEAGHAGRFLICRTCGTAAEIDDGDLEQALAATAERHGFKMHRATLEVAGLCPSCVD